jgi:hypothetical protein
MAQFGGQTFGGNTFGGNTFGGQTFGDPNYKPGDPDPNAQGNNTDYLSLMSNPTIAMLLALAPHNSDLAAHLLAMVGGKAPSLGPMSKRPAAGGTPRTQEDTGKDTQGTQVSPPPPGPELKTTATGASVAAPSTTGIPGADGQAQSQSQPPPVATSPVPDRHEPGSALALPPKETTAWGGASNDPSGPIGTSTPLPGSPQVQDTSTGDTMKKIGDTIQKSFGAIKMPEDKWTPMPQPQLPQITHRFSPTDLLSMIGQLSTPGQKLAAPLGALIGGQR